MAVTFFFLLPGYYRGGGRLKSKMLTRKMTLNGSGLETDYRFTLARGGGGRGGKKVYFPVDRCSPKSK